MKLPCLICLTCKIFYSINKKIIACAMEGRCGKENNRKMSNYQLVLGPLLFLFQMYEFSISLRDMERYPRGSCWNLSNFLCIKLAKANNFQSTSNYSEVTGRKKRARQKAQRRRTAVGEWKDKNWGTQMYYLAKRRKLTARWRVTALPHLSGHFTQFLTHCLHNSTS